MNDYNFNYLNYMMNIPQNTDFINEQINFNNSNQLPYPNQPTKIITDPRTGLTRGNLFTNLYNPYKNYQPAELTPKNEQEALKYQIMQYKFALTELNLYLDINPNDRNILTLYNKYLTIEKEICDKYERTYGPLTTDSPYITNGYWNWNKTPWPWEEK